MKNTLLSLLIICSILSQPLYGKSLFPHMDKENAYKEYFRVHKHFFKKLCSPGSYQKYFRLYSKFRGEGYFIPLLNERELDVKTIQNSLPMIVKKIEWIKKQIRYLKRRRSFPRIKRINKNLLKAIDELVSYKDHFYHNASSEERNKIKNKSEKMYVELIKEYDRFLSKIPFLLNVDFPVDHFNLRKKHDQFSKERRLSLENERRFNENYFLRKIYEDGVLKRSFTRADLFLRSLISTLKIRLKEKKSFIPEDIRYDLNIVLEKVGSILNEGKRTNIRRLQFWLKRTRKAHAFYKRLLKDYKTNKKGRSYQYLANLSKAKKEIINYNDNKQLSIYKYWMKRKPYLRAIFSLETILYNEVGSLDQKTQAEKRDVAQVVINRVFDNFYSKLNQNDPLYKLFIEEDRLHGTEYRQKLDQYPWLNTLFKLGEFSFTYYFMAGSVHLYCPDMSRYGKIIRRSNVKLAIELLDNPKTEFKALRYFSRGGMLGGIDMTLLWDGYIKIPERPGPIIVHSPELFKKLKKGQYAYQYSFRAPDNRLYDVIEFQLKGKKKKYVISRNPKSNKIQFFHFRNPQLFRYFTQK